MESAAQNTLKPINSKTLYNLTQDEFHLVVFDLRERSEFMKAFVRKSYNLNPSDFDIGESLKVLEFIKRNDCNASLNEHKHKQTSHLRRAVFVLEATDKQCLQRSLEFVSNNNIFDSFDRRYVL